MDDLKYNELLQPAYITKLIDEILPDSSEYALVDDVPMETQETEQIIIDIRDNIGGMTNAVSFGAESPIVEHRGRAQASFQAAEFREKTLLSERDLQVVRKQGTAAELERAEDRMLEIAAGLRMRLETRIEWCRWQMLFGRLIINQEDVQYDINYKVPTEFKPVLTGTDLWSAIATADPIDDMLNWVDLYRDEGQEPEYFMFNTAVFKLLLQNAKIRELAEGYFVNNPVSDNLMNKEILGKIITAFVGYPFKVYDKGYFFKMKLETPITPTSTSFVVSENSGVVANDYVTVVHKDGYSLNSSARVQVTPTGLSFAHTAIGGTVTYPVGSTIRTKKRYLPDDTFVIRGSLPPGTTGGQNFGEFISTPSAYNGGLMDAQPGPFGKTVVDNDGDPPKAYVLAGIRGLPVMYHPRTNVVATVQ